MSWESLPGEIHAHILEALVLHGDSARYASTCRTWQAFIEQRNFTCLKVTQSRLAGFSDIGYRHRHLVKCIWFSIEPSYNHCPHCGGVGVYNWHQVSSKVIRKAIQDLVIELSRWEPSGSLLLDVSVKPPSGLMHSSSIIQYAPPVISEPKKDQIIQCSHCSDKDLLIATTLLINEKFRKVREPEPKPSKKMPKARAVTSLLLRRQTRHPWKSEALEELLDLLPEVYEFHYESWRDWRRMEERPTDTSKARDTSPWRCNILLKLFSYNAAMQVT